MTTRGESRRRLLAGVGFALLASLTGCAEVVSGISRRASDAEEARFRAWLESQPSVAAIESIMSGNYEGDVWARATVRLTQLAVAPLTEVSTGFFAEAGRSHWTLSVRDRISPVFDSRDDPARATSMADTWAALSSRPGIASGRLSASRFQLVAGSDPIIEGLSLVRQPWAGGYEFAIDSAQTATVQRTFSFTPGTIDDPTVAELTELAQSLDAGLRLRLTSGTQSGSLTVTVADADRAAAEGLVDSLACRDRFTVSYVER